MSSKAASSTTGYDSSREDGPPDILQVSGLRSNCTSGSSAANWNCPQCGVQQPAVVKEIAKLKKAVEYAETKYHDQFMVNCDLKQLYYCRGLEYRCDAAERELVSKGQEEARTTELHALKESAVKWKKKANIIQQRCKDLEERLQEIEESRVKMHEECKRLRDVLAKAFCKSRLSPTEMDKVIVQQIPNDQEHIRTWIDFLNPLEMPQSMMSLEMSPKDARANVCDVLLAWLGGKGSPEKPRTWGTLLDAMHRGSQYLQELANRAEYILLEELASLRMEFHVCVICRKETLQNPSEETGNEWVEDGVVHV